MGKLNSKNIRGKAIVVQHFGGTEVLQIESIVCTPPPVGYVRIKIVAISVGYTDIMARRGEYIFQRHLPFTPGYGFAGEVVDFQPSSEAPSWLKPGVRVAVSLPQMGAYTQYTLVPIALLVPVPEEVATPTAAAITLDYLTAISMLTRHARVKSGDCVLIQGAAGGVGMALCQLGKIMGLKMYGTASSKDFATLKAYGVHPIDFAAEDFENVVRQAEPGGIQAVFDHIGGQNLSKGYRLLSTHGTLVSFAFVGRPGHIMHDTIRGFLHNHLLGILPGKRTAVCMVPQEIKKDPIWYQENLAYLLSLARYNKIQLTIGKVFPLEEAALAHEALASHTVPGKILLSTTQ